VDLEHPEHDEPKHNDEIPVDDRRRDTGGRLIRRCQRIRDPSAIEDPLDEAPVQQLLDEIADPLEDSPPDDEYEQRNEDARQPLCDHLPECLDFGEQLVPERHDSPLPLMVSVDSRPRQGAVYPVFLSTTLRAHSVDRQVR
jgi:hypothetical protein